MLTLAEAQAAPSIKRIIGVCPTSQDATDLIAEAARRLRRRGDFAETTFPYYACVYNGCVVLNRYFQAVRRVMHCRHHIPVDNGQGMWLSGAMHKGWQHWCQGEAHWSPTGVSPVFQDIQGEGRLIRAYARCQADLGKTMTVFGIDNNGQPLTYKDANGVWQPGAVITLAAPFGSTSTFVRKIDYVVREATQCIVDVYAYNASTNLLEDIAHYEPDVITPSYQRASVNVPSPSCGTTTTPACCGSKRGVMILAKVAAIDPKRPSDLVCIPNVDALKLMIMSIKREDAGERDNARIYEHDAIEILNRELEDLFPDDTFTAANNTLGPHVWSNQAF